MNNTLSTIPGITLSGGFRFRNGQRIFLQKFADELLQDGRNHLGVFVPGYGKTITALASFLVARSLSVAQKLVIFVPRGNLRDQYANPADLAVLMRNLGAPPLTFSVADSEKMFLKNLNTDVIITTYQYASGKAGSEALEQFCRRTQCMFVFDEVHHLSEDGTWAMNIKKFPFSCSVALSGTPVRSDNKSLFGVPTEITCDEAGRATQYYKPLHEVLLRDAHAEMGVLKRIQAHIVEYTIKLKNTETGAIVELSLTRLSEEASNPAEIDSFLARKQLRFHEVYLENLLTPAFEQLSQKRRNFPPRSNESSQQHQMLIIAMSNLHAAAILDFVQARFPQFTSGRIGQDLPEKERAKSLKAYRAGEIDVMVQVDMIGEGTDIKPISVIVKADLVRAFSKTMQQIFRGMRFYAPFGEEGNVCDIYTSNDSEVVQILEWLTNEEQLGVSVKTQQGRGKSAVAASPQVKESWDLLTVEHNETATHALSPGNGCMIPEPIIKTKGKKKQETFFAIDNEREKIQLAIEASAREKELRQECLGLVVKLAQLLPKEAIEPHSSGITAVHFAALRRFSKHYEQMTHTELAAKREWLKECMKEKRVIEQ